MHDLTDKEDEDLFNRILEFLGFFVDEQTSFKNVNCLKTLSDQDIVLDDYGNYINISRTKRKTSKILSIKQFYIVKKFSEHIIDNPFLENV